MATSIVLLDFAKRLKTLRKERGLSRRGLAELAGVPAYMIKTCEEGGDYHGLQNLGRLADFFGLSLHAFVYGSGKRE